ncbi:MAG: hypothetical protein WC807_05980 [Hyphomicrobium sp.]|jgi:hypothetical protein
MDDLDPFERGTHTFSGTVRLWSTNSAELVTDSGLVLFLDTRGQPPVPPGTRVTVVTRKYRPCHLVMRVTPG